MKKTAFISIALCGIVASCASLKQKKHKAPVATTSVATSPYKKIVTSKTITQKGLFNIHITDNQYYFEIPLTLFDRSFLIVNKVSKVPEKLNDAGINKGMNYQNQLISLELDTVYNKVFFRKNNGLVDSDSSHLIHQSVRDNFIPSVIDAFTIEAYGEEKQSVIIKVNKIFDGSTTSINNIFENLGLTSIAANKEFSRIISSKSFTKNIVVKAELSAKITGVPISVEATTNIVLLDKVPMQPRFADRRLGYFTTPKWYFNDQQHAVEKRELITRWRLEPKPEDVEKYLNGTLVEPAKPIVYYIDPATPKQWQQAIIDGIHDWQKAFEKAGFKNAIQARLAPTNDPNFDPDDVQYSVVTYAASEKANAMGPSVIDPRSGEIIEADIIWWHNVISILDLWLRVQTSAIDAQAQKPQLSDSLMASAIRFVSSHEVGHTLGLPHNMGSSFAFPVDSLRSASFTQQMGGTAPSIMDYARFNYIAQPGDGVQQITPVIGAYDMYAIHWGYTFLNKKTPQEELPILHQWIQAKADNPLYRFREQQPLRETIDPSAQSEDLGNNHIKASNYGIKNLKRMMPNIIKWTKEDGKTYALAGKFLNGIIGQWHQYAYHVLANIGGIYITPTVYQQNADSYTFVAKKTQQEAVQYLIKEVFTTPKWLFNDSIFRKTYAIKESPIGDIEYAPLMYLKNIQSFIFYDLLKDERLSRMLENEASNKQEAYTVVALLNDLYKGIFAKTIAGKPLDIWERNTQKGYIDALIVSINKSAELPNTSKKIMNQQPLFTLPCLHNEHCARNILYHETKRVSDAISAKRGTLNAIYQLLTQQKKIADIATRYHYEDILLRIQIALEKK